jgi:hypothetical protein
MAWLHGCHLSFLHFLNSFFAHFPAVFFLSLHCLLLSHAILLYSKLGCFIACTCFFYLLLGCLLSCSAFSETNVKDSTHLRDYAKSALRKLAKEEYKILRCEVNLKVSRNRKNREAQACEITGKEATN